MLLRVATLNRINVRSIGSCSIARHTGGVRCSSVMSIFSSAMDQAEAIMKAPEYPLVGLNTVKPPSQEALRSWLQKHADLLKDERKADKEDSHLLLSNCPPKQLENYGLAIRNLSVASTSIGLGGKSIVELEKSSSSHQPGDFRPHSLRSGDIVEIQDNLHDPSRRDSSKNTFTVQGIVFRVTKKKISIAISSNIKKGDPRQAGTSSLESMPALLRVVKITNDAVTSRMELALVKLAKQLDVPIKTESKAFEPTSSDEELDENSSAHNLAAETPQDMSSPLVRALVGLEMPQWNMTAEEAMQLQLFGQTFNESQIDAIKFALAAEHFALIHGPPGTGKTSTVAEIALQFAVNQGKNVLICGPSNLAADNLMERILTQGKDALRKNLVNVTRLGHPARVLPTLMERTLDHQLQYSKNEDMMKDLKHDLEQAISSLKPKDVAGNKSTSKRGQASAKSRKLNARERHQRLREISQLRKEYRRRESDLTRSILEGAQIIVSTCHGSGVGVLGGIDFDVVIIDEACQAMEAACWIAVNKAHKNGKLILSGDHLQLPPTVKGTNHSQQRQKIAGAAAKEKKAQSLSAKTTKDDLDNGGKEQQLDHDDEIRKAESFAAPVTTSETKLRPPRSLETTMFSRLLGMYGQGCKALLNTQYRMNEEIMAFPNHALYEGKIKAHESCAHIRLRDYTQFAPNDRPEFLDDEVYSAPLVFYDTAGLEMYESQTTALESESLVQLDSRSNLYEAEIVAMHCKLLIDKGLDPERIMVLSPYSLQVKDLSIRLHGGEDAAMMQGVTIGSIDSVQGMENDVVIISLVRSNDRGEIGFLAEQRRLNVAMTRAKRQICIVGDSETISRGGDVYLKGWMNFLEAKAFIGNVVP